MIEELLGKKVVIDLASQYVAIGTLARIDAAFLELRSADLHDLRDTDTTREVYVAESVSTGIKRNRKRVLIALRDIVAVSAFRDVAID
jgi:hypothetical protein